MKRRSRKAKERAAKAVQRKRSQLEPGDESKYARKKRGELQTHCASRPSWMIRNGDVTKIERGARMAVAQ